MNREKITLRVAEKIGIHAESYDELTEEQKAFFNSLPLSSMVKSTVVSAYYSGVPVTRLEAQFGMLVPNIYRAAKEI